MGWTFTHKPQGQGVVDFLRQEIDGDNERGTWKVLDGAAHLKAAYLAVERFNKSTGVRHVYGLVCLIQYAKDPRYNFGYKDMSDDMHPYHYDCPERVLARLSPTDNPHALAWRAKCRERIQRRQDIKGLKAGDVLVFGRTFRWTLSRSREVIEAGVLRVEDPKRLVFRAFYDGRHALLMRREDLLANPFTVFEDRDAYLASLEGIQAVPLAA